MSPPPAPPQDFYLIGFLIFGLPILLLMAGIGIVALKKRWKSVAYICGAIFLLTAGNLFWAARQRQQPGDVLIVQGIGLACGLGGGLLILIARRFRPSALGPDHFPAGRSQVTLSPPSERSDAG